MTHRDIAIVSGCTELRYASYVGHQLYARRHGLDYHPELTAFDGVSGYWHKVAALRAHLAQHEWVVWFDDDAFITDLGSTFLTDEIAAAEAEGSWLVIAPSCDDELNGAWAAYNTGVFALRRTPEAESLLESMAHAPMAEIEAWWDADRLGMFTRGDQDALVWFMETNALSGSIRWVDPLRWNARPWHFSVGLDDAPVCHFPGHPDKTLAITSFARRMGTDETLVRERKASHRARSVHGQVAVAGPVSEVVRRTSLRGQQLGRRVRRKAAWVREHRRWS